MLKGTGSKFIVVLAVLWFAFPWTAFAAEDAPRIDTGDTTWLLVSAALVLFMHIPGLALFYGGLVSNRNVVSTMMYSFVSLLVVTVVWVLWGYSLSFGSSIGGILGGFDYVLFNNVGMEPALGTLTIPHYLFALFQSIFAAITVAIVSGGVIGRASFKAWIFFIVLWSTFVYAPMAYWVWGGGWLYKLGELDFAGGTVVHILSGVSALVAAMVIGPRRGYPHHEHRPHNIVLFLMGAGALWLGWFGFNGGSALASGGVASLAVTTTHIAGAAGGLGWLLMEWMIRKRPTLVGASTGAISGLVAITPAAGYVTIASALLIGFLAGPICYYGIHIVKNRLKYDDTLDAFGVHGIGGVWGALATGIFASEKVNPAGRNGLLYGNPEQLLHQLIGVSAAIALAAVGTFVVLKAVSLFTTLRVSEEEEKIGLDLSFHEEPAYDTITFHTAHEESYLNQKARHIAQ